MAKGYSKDLRARAVALVEDGESRREAARVLGLGASTTIRWIERWATTGSVAALPGTGHSRSPLEAHRQWLLDLVAAEPDLTLEKDPLAAQIREAAENRYDLGLALLRTPRNHVQKKLCTLPNRIVLMSLRRVPS
jgi:transposase